LATISFQLDLRGNLSLGMHLRVRHSRRNHVFPGKVSNHQLHYAASWAKIQCITWCIWGCARFNTVILRNSHLFSCTKWMRWLKC